MGNICTRNCPFCATKTGKPLPLDKEEPQKIVKAVQKLDLHYVVLTSVTRDDLPDGGSAHYVKVIQALRKHDNNLKIEVLIPDFKGNPKALEKISAISPTVINHNIETVPKLYKIIRPEANYERSLEVLKYFKKNNPSCTTKSGLMVGLGETEKEVMAVMKDLIKVKTSILTIGQYLSPSKNHFPVRKYLEPDLFQKYKDVGLKFGFDKVISGPFVRSSYFAEKYYEIKKEKEKVYV